MKTQQASDSASGMRQKDVHRYKARPASVAFRSHPTAAVADCLLQDQVKYVSGRAAPAPSIVQLNHALATGAFAYSV